MLIWKIQLSKLFEVKLRRFVIGARRFFDGFVSAKMSAMIIHPDISLPSLFSIVPRHATKTRRVIPVHFLPTGVFLRRYYSKIFTSVIESVSVDMIDDISLRWIADNGVMKSKQPSGVCPSVALHQVNAPIILVEFFKNVIINYCFIALRKFYFFCQLNISFIGRLVNNIIPQKVAQ